MRLFRNPAVIGNSHTKPTKFEGIKCPFCGGIEMSKTELQRSQENLRQSLNRMADTMGGLNQHMDETEKKVKAAADQGHSFLGEIDTAAAQFIAGLGGSNGPEDAVNQEELAGGRDSEVGAA